MGLKFYFNQKAWEALAKQLRILAWSISVIVTAAGYQLSNGWVLMSSGFIWVMLQIIAFVLESLQRVDGNERSKEK